IGGTMPAASSADLLLDCLCYRVRMLTLEQVEAACALADSSARQMIARLEKEGLVEPHTVWAIYPPPLTGTLYSWSPGAPIEEDAVQAAVTQGVSRWRGVPRVVRCWSAAAQAVRRYGGSGRCSRASDASHDLLWSQIAATDWRELEVWKEDVLHR